MLLLCSGNGRLAALTSTVYFVVLLSASSTRECALQLAKKLKSRSVIFRNVDKKICQTECIEDSFIFVSCEDPVLSEESKKVVKTTRSRIHPENLPRVLTESCGSTICNETSHCVTKGCKKVCEEAPPLCDLHTASKAGDLARVKLLFSQGRANVDCQEWIGRTPVMWAAAGGHTEVVDLLVSKGANLLLVDNFGINILHSACVGGDVEVVKYILSQNMLGISGRVRCKRTPVMLAAENGHKDVVKLLVDKGADVSLVDAKGNNILHCACRGGDVEVVKYIISKEMVDINSRRHQQKTPVMVGTIHGHTEVVELLVKHGADLSLKDKSENNILHMACYCGRVDLVKCIISLNSVDINSRGHKKKTPAMVGADAGHKDVVELLVKHGADLSLRRQGGNSILHLPCSSGRFDVVKYLLSLNSVDINSRGYRKGTPLMFAAGKGQKEMVELLIEQGADLSLRNRLGRNVIHVACSSGQFDVVEYLLSLNSLDINSRGHKKRTPMMEAAKHGHKDVVELLVKHGANLLLTDVEGKSSLDLARQERHMEVVQYVMSL